MMLSPDSNTCIQRWFQKMFHTINRIIQLELCICVLILFHICLVIPSSTIGFSFSRNETGV